jgi:Flp pilus assembly protein protease CpaA
MSASLETRQFVSHNRVPRASAWRMALAAPLVLVLPWIALCRSLYVPEEFGTLRGLLLVLLLATATLTDLQVRRIYNWTTYTAFGWVVLLEVLGTLMGGASEGTVGFASTVVSALGALPWRESLAGFAAGFGILFVLYNVFRGGAGDLKLVAVLGALVGVHRIIEILIYSYILAGVFAACVMVGVVRPMGLLAFAARGLGLSAGTPESSQSVTACLKRQVPMAPFLASGSLLALVCG